MTVARKRLYPWQLSLRTLLAVITFSCVGLAEYAWRQERQRALVLKVEAFNRTIDERRYEAAYRIALQARSEYPSEPVAELVMEKALFARQIRYADEYVGGRQGGCVLVDED